MRPAWDCATKVHTAVPHDDGDDDDVGGNGEGDGEDDYHGDWEAWLADCHKGTTCCGSAFLALQRALHTQCTTYYSVIYTMHTSHCILHSKIYTKLCPTYYTLGTAVYSAQGRLYCKLQ